MARNQPGRRPSSSGCRQPKARWRTSNISWKGGVLAVESVRSQNLADPRPDWLRVAPDGVNGQHTAVPCWAAHSPLPAAGRPPPCAYAHPARHNTDIAPPSPPSLQSHGPNQARAQVSRSRDSRLRASLAGATGAGAARHPGQTLLRARGTRRSPTSRARAGRYFTRSGAHRLTPFSCGMVAAGRGGNSPANHRLRASRRVPRLLTVRHSARQR